MIVTKKNNFEFKINALALILIIIANFCFYTSETINLYIIMTIAGCCIALVSNFKYFSFKIYKSNYFIWLTLIYLVFFFYGFYFLQSGKFLWDSFLIRYIENLSLYLSITGLFRNNGEDIIAPFSFVALFAIIYLIF